MTRKDFIFFSTLAVWVGFIFIVIVGGDALGIEHLDTFLFVGEVAFIFMLTAVLVVARLVRRFGE